MYGVGGPKAVGVFQIYGIHSTLILTRSGLPCCWTDQGTDRDLIGEIAEAAKTHGVVFGAYFSKADWHAGTRAVYYVCI